MSQNDRWHVVDGPPSWPRGAFGGWSEFFLRDDDWWRGDERAMETPCFVAGYTFEAERAGALLADDMEAWRARLAEQQIDVFDEGQYMCCARALYLNELVTAGVTLDDQAAALAPGLRPASDLIDDMGPPLTPQRSQPQPTARPRARRQPGGEPSGGR